MKKPIQIILSLVLLASAFSIPSTSTAATKTMKVHYINVGQGDATYIKMPGGEDVLIDGGRQGQGDEVIAYLKKQKVDDIEILISTHPDADHLGGLDEVLKAYKVESVYAPKVSHTTDAFENFLKAVKAEKLTIKTAKAGVKLSLRGVTAKFVGPTKEFGKSDLNNWSAVLHVTYDKNKFLFAGDAEKASETDMVKAKQTLQADVLKVGHHGAKTSSNTDFLKVVKPKYAVISVGKNAYGHPTTDVLNRFKTAKATIYRTDQKGNIVFTSTGTKITIATNK
ncbi:ComEC/Rec2 family competence protein [Planococcus sp. N028]|uniref:ComEC/Rec2 family competence protein n=1 Tax=Planococcus shixiaomingii TaxID=3058393 RepID=A0ABT8N2W0_9BACL|nr:ComEC/Rec2 family competence protein [Planococcus sp. N028]MDN7242216.1 ComEC/Rec2 family competence protein [Planococcus sp. N028]